MPLIVDNTLATPYLCKPIEYGADIVVHSLTKFLGGHGNSIGGMIVDGGTFDWSRDDALSDAVGAAAGISRHQVLHETFGNFAFAIACRVLGLARPRARALAVQRVPDPRPASRRCRCACSAHCDNALAVAEWLSKHNEVAWVSYRRAAGRPLPRLAQKYARRARAPCFTFGLKGGYDAGVKLVSNVKLFSHLANIGDTRSLIIHPASTTHRQLSRRSRRCRPAPARTSCASRSASKTWTTSSPTSIRRWRPSSSRRHRAEPAERPGLPGAVSVRHERPRW